MKLQYIVSAMAGVAVVLAQNSTLTTCQSDCADTALAANSTCGTTAEACACDNTFVQNVKICLYKGSCSSDVATWFDTATDLCEATGTEANYTSIHDPDYSYSEAAGASSTANVASSATSAASAASSSAASSGSLLHELNMGGALVAVLGAVAGGVMLM